MGGDEKKGRVARQVHPGSVMARDQGEDEEGLSAAWALLKELDGWSDSQWDSTIARCIYALGDYAEFAHRFRWIGQMDYAFGFFVKVIDRALRHIDKELRKYGGNSWWVDAEEGVSVTANAGYFADNFCTIVVRIIHHLLFRAREIEGVRNIEWWVASQRLREDEVDRIIALQGPFRSQYAMQRAVDNIFIW